MTLLVMMLTTATAWADEETYTFTSKTWEATNSAGNEANWTSGGNGNVFTSGQGVQVPTGHYGANGTSPVSFNNISKIVVTYCTNANKGAGTINVLVGGGNEQLFEVTKEGGTTLREAEFTYSPAKTGNVNVAVFCMENSIYIHSVKITYTPSAGGNTPTYAVTYNGNGATSGSVPTDNNSYQANTKVTVKGNTGNLVKTGNAFSGWNTLANGQGTTYAANSTFNITSNTTLYAKWTPYTITAQSNNTNYGTVTKEGFVITGHPVAGYSYDSPAYTVSSGTATVVQQGDNFTVTPTSNCTVKINFKANPTHTATFSVNGETTSSSFKEGQAITFPSDPAAIRGKAFVGWLKNSTISGTTNEAPSFVEKSNETMGNSNITYYAVFANVKKGDATTVTDKLTRETTGVANNSNTYSDWSGKKGASGAVYAGNSAGEHNAIQLRYSSLSRSGIVSTSSGSGRVTKVKVSWNSSTSSNRTLDVYGGNCQYDKVSDLSNSPKLGSLYYKATIDNKETTTTELTIDYNDEIEYIGFCPETNSGTLFLDEIDIEWTTGTPDACTNYSTTVSAELAANAITGINDSYTIDLAKGDDEIDLSSATATSGAPVQFTVLSNTMGENYSLTNGVLEVWSCNVITIHAYVDGDANYQATEKIVTVTVIDNPSIYYDGETVETAYGTPYTVDPNLIDGGAVSLQSGNTSVATVSGLAITPVAVGSVTITINTEATNIWHAGSATFTLNVTPPEGSVTAPSPYAFNETFDGFTKDSDNRTTFGGNGEGYNLFSGNAGASPFLADKCDESGWVVTNGGAGYQCAKFGTNDNAGSATTRSISVEKGKTYHLSFKAAPWNYDNAIMNVTATGATVSGINTAPMTNDKWNDYTATVTATAESITLTFAADEKRFFLDEVKLSKENPTTEQVRLCHLLLCKSHRLQFDHRLYCMACEWH
jgi:hypothetical protein